MKHIQCNSSLLFNCSRPVCREFQIKHEQPLLEINFIKKCHAARAERIMEMEKLEEKQCTTHSELKSTKKLNSEI